MRSIIAMDNIQIEITNACNRKCCNCTRFCGHLPPYMMPLEEVKHAIDCCTDYPKITGIMGGEPLFHPQFEEICKYALEKIGRNRLGLWSCFPEGYEKYAKTICDTFEHVFVNDHSRGDIFHAPILVAAEEVIPNRQDMFIAINECWLQNSWSASINPRGAFFCEVAAAMSILFRGTKGWPVEPGWWKRTPKDYREQIEEYCPKCGVCLPLRRKSSIEIADDISPRNFERLKDYSLKIKRCEYVIHDLRVVHPKELEQMGRYKDLQYRDQIANRYGIYFTINWHNYWEPHLLTKHAQLPEKTFFEELLDASKEGEK